MRIESNDTRDLIVIEGAYDEAEVCVAVELGMRNDETGMLRRILLSLQALGEHVDIEHIGPSKQHGLPPAG